jgi:hypothetical protein
MIILAALDNERCNCQVKGEVESSEQKFFASPPSRQQPVATTYISSPSQRISGEMMLNTTSPIETTNQLFCLQNIPNVSIAPI